MLRGIRGVVAQATPERRAPSNAASSTASSTADGGVGVGKPRSTTSMSLNAMSILLWALMDAHPAGDDGVRATRRDFPRHGLPTWRALPRWTGLTPSVSFIQRRVPQTALRWINWPVHRDWRTVDPRQSVARPCI